MQRAISVPFSSYSAFYQYVDCYADSCRLCGPGSENYVKPLQLDIVYTEYSVILFTDCLDSVANSLNVYEIGISQKNIYLWLNCASIQESVDEHKCGPKSSICQ